MISFMGYELDGTW